MKSLKEGTRTSKLDPAKTTHQLFELKFKDDLFGTLLFPNQWVRLPSAETRGKWTFAGRVFSTRTTVKAVTKTYCDFQTELDGFERCFGIFRR